jgi:hypothetical protein
MGWKDFSFIKLLISIIILIIGLVLKFVLCTLESLPPKCKIFSFIFTQYQINIISLLLIILSIIYIIIILILKFKIK